MKKILAAMLAAAAVLSVTGCNRGGDVTDSSNHTTGESQMQNANDSLSGSSSSSVSSADSSASSTATSTATSSDSAVSKPESSVPVVSGSSSSEPPGETSSSESTSTEQSVPEAHEHKYDTQKFEPTCEESGFILYHCSCGDLYREFYAEALGHNFTQNVVNATCTAEGYTNYNCSRCGYHYTADAVGPKGHVWGDWATTIEPTTTSEGEEVSICSECGEKQRRSIPKPEGVSAYVSAVVSLVNDERAKAGLSPLTESEGLNEFAQLRSSELVDNFAHKRPDGSSPLDYVMNMDGIHRAGENIAMGYSTPEAVMEGWMNSTGHRENILKSEFTMIGVGCYEYNGRYYWTQIFGG